LHLFEGFGIETECMLVDGQSLDVRPLSDQVFRAVCGEVLDDFADGAIGWSNELALHVLELKTIAPVPSLSGLAETFGASIARLNRVLRPLNARALPGAMHPWMVPQRETRIWPHVHHEVYQLYDRLFDCRRHGWANVQSTQLNLPFTGDEEFGRLHAAVRVVLPLLPALAAASPIVEGRATGFLDTRLTYYGRISERVPEIAGRVIPEQVFEIRSYHEQVLEPMYRAVAPLDPQGALRNEWLNARGAIPRFDRSAIEIRVVDAQECPRSDLAIAFATAAVVRACVEERWAGYGTQKAWEIEPLARIYQATVEHGPQAEIADPRYAALFGLRSGARLTAGGLWRHLVETAVAPAPDAPEFLDALRLILERGTLAERLLRAVGQDDSPARLRSVAARLAECIEANEPFED
jgi:gamma-glutamyl:cysteine ligase YbdK (ATP-grasp superfamily)